MSETTEQSESALLLAYYGDDFTGSTDSMEALAINGVRTVLFLQPPDPQLLREQFADIQAFGVAGISRSLAPEAMDRELRPVFEALKSHVAPIVHYKMCSTFDSAPHVGSLGQAIDTAASVFTEQSYIPLLVGVPVLKRYTVFGQHFAGVQGQVHRLDRHPTMSKHPMTPMDEADLRIHLSKQTDKSIELLNILELEGSFEQSYDALSKKLQAMPGIVLFDVLDEPKLLRAGELLWQQAQKEAVSFVAGSSGVQYALTACWREQGLLDEKQALLAARGPVDRLFAVSGSCSPVTEAQIRYSLENGFTGIKVNTAALIDPDEAEATRRQLLQDSLELLEQGKSPLLYTALGSEDLSIDEIKDKLQRSGYERADTGRLIGEQLGKLTREVVAEAKLSRVLVAGGDTSGYATRELGIYALECLMPLAPGGPLCRGFSEDPRFQGIEIALKGGQVGGPDYFVRTKEGR